MPACDTSPNVGFSPTTPHQADGMRTDPAWSPPKATSTSPAATATADPDDEPPVSRPGARGLTGSPWSPYVP